MRKKYRYKSVEHYWKKSSLSQIETKIAGAGYKANSTSADKSAYDNLPRCCKVDG